MMDSRNRIRSLLETVADGDPVDWAREKASFEDDADRRSLELLEAIAGVSTFHRADELSQGTVLGDLVISDRLGRGSYGDVYLARDRKLDRDVAIKLFRDPSWKSTFDAAGVPRFLSEARRLARIRHSNVVAIHAADMQQMPDGTEVPAIVLEPVHGVSLDELVAREGPRGAGEIISIGLELCRALSAVHGAGIVHQDMKPQNVMREEGGRIVLMDFGPGGVTPLVMAPEIFAKCAPTAQSDLYGLGVILFYLATGSYPVNGRSFDDLAKAHLVGDRRSLRDARPDLPSDLVAVIERALAPDPAARFKSAGSLERALVRDPRTSERPTRGRLVLLAAVAIGLAALFVIVSQRREEKPVESGVAHELALTDRMTDGSNEAAPYEISASFYRGAAQRERVAAGSQVVPGDSLSLVFRASVRVWFYVLNEDDAGESYVLHPGIGFTPQNPLVADADHVLPGKRAGKSAYWKVTSRGGRERLLLVASPRKLDFLESEVAGMARPSEDRPVISAPVPPVQKEALLKLRGLGGYAMTSDSDSPETAALFELAEPLTSGSETVRGVWIRGIELENR